VSDVEELKERIMVRDTVCQRLWKDDVKKLQKMRDELGFGNIANCVRLLLKDKRRQPVTVEKIMNETVPVVITGHPLSGKTTFVKKKLLPKLNPHPVMVIDIWGEYKELKDCKSDIYSLDFKTYKGKLRFVPQKLSLVAEKEIEFLFNHLDMKRDQLSDWVLIVEEAHSFKDIPAFSKFLYGSRRIVRKLVCVTPKTDAFPGLVTFTVSRKDQL